MKNLEHIEKKIRHEKRSAEMSLRKRKAIKLGRLFCVALSILPAMAYAKVCDVRTYGAKGDGVTKDTKAIQAAIDDCAAAGGGTVRLGRGTFVSGPIKLKNDLEFDVEKGAVLLGSADRDDYPKAVRMRQQTVEPLIAMTNATNVTIKGGGVIDGQGKVWWDYVKGVKDSGVLGTDHPRPMLLLIDHSKHIVVEDVTIQNSGFWQVVPYYSDDLVFRNLRILAPQRGAPNTDAIDPFSSNHVTIDHVFASTGDDNVAIKSGAINSPGPDAPSHDITITDCEFEGGHGLSIGSEVAGGVQNVHAERIHFKGTDQGIRVKANRERGNDVSNLSSTARAPEREHQSASHGRTSSMLRWPHSSILKSSWLVRTAGMQRQQRESFLSLSFSSEGPAELQSRNERIRSRRLCGRSRVALLPLAVVFVDVIERGNLGGTIVSKRLSRRSSPVKTAFLSAG